MASESKNIPAHPDDQSEVALLLIDVINDFEFADGAELLKSARPMAKNIARLKKRAKEARVPVIYVNDNFGKWQSDFKKQLAHCLREGVRGRLIAGQLAPDEQDYFVLKPMHSGFFTTTLELLLSHLKSKTLILTGVTTDMCILFTANDAYMRGYKVIVPEDCVAAVKKDHNENALAFIRRVLKAETPLAAEINFEGLDGKR